MSLNGTNGTNSGHGNNISNSGDNTSINNIGDSTNVSHNNNAMSDNSNKVGSNNNNVGNINNNVMNGHAHLMEKNELDDYFTTFRDRTFRHDHWKSELNATQLQDIETYPDCESAIEMMGYD
jgi:hypothetical protein